MNTDHKTADHQKISDSVRHAADGSTHDKALSDAAEYKVPADKPKSRTALDDAVDRIAALEARLAYLTSVYGWPHAEHDPKGFGLAPLAGTPTAPTPLPGQGDAAANG